MEEDSLNGSTLTHVQKEEKLVLHLNKEQNIQRSSFSSWQNNTQNVDDAFRHVCLLNIPSASFSNQSESKFEAKNSSMSVPFNEEVTDTF